MDCREFLTLTLEKVSQMAIDLFGKVPATLKSEDYNQVVTEADREIGKSIIEAIQQVYPEYNIIDEEAGVIDNESEYTWVIDPIDGTSNFAQGIPMYGIMMGLLKESEPIAGGIALPAFGEIYIAEKGAGAYCNTQKLAVSSETSLPSALIAYGIDGHRETPNVTRRECNLVAEIILHCRNLRMSNSVFDTIMVAKGKYGGFLHQTSRIWDNVAQHVLIEEAGGSYTDFFGKPVDYSHPLSKVKDNFAFCTAPPALHQQLQSIVRRIHTSS
ncbi:MAG TPA: inositol monophosphatase [Ktedonobacteraceae bacterium]